MIAKHAAKLDLTQSQVSVRILLHLAVTAGGGVHDMFQALEADGVEQAFGKHGHAVLPAEAAALDDGASKNIAKMIPG